MRTYSPKAKDVTRVWHVIDASDVILGRLAVQAATLLRGKHKAYFAPHVDTGDFVIVINAGLVAMSGNKRADKEYIRHSGFPGGLSRRSYESMLSTRPEVVVEKAIKGMLPHTSLGRAQGSKLKVYAGAEHPHAAQQPVPFTITQVSQV